MARAKGGFLDRAYDLDDAEKTRAFYEEWAATYEAETLANGYVTPGRCAAALAACATAKSAPLLDLGCGTGLSGLAFRDAGFTCIDGSDFSEEMLACARTKQGVYRALVTSDLNDPLPGAPGEYANIAAVGVFSPGHAPPEMIDAVIEKLPAGGCFVFSLNDHTLEIPGYEAHIDAMVDDGRARIAFREYGDHLPKRDLGAVVVVLRRI